VALEPELDAALCAAGIHELIDGVYTQRCVARAQLEIGKIQGAK
jgi:hypothetical protein